jgi:hypothetical protein
LIVPSSAACWTAASDAFLYATSWPSTSPAMKIPSVHRRPRFCAVGVGLAGGQAGQQAQGLVHGFDRPDVELAGFGRFHDVLAEHQVLDVRFRDEDALGPAQPALVDAGFEETSENIAAVRKA